MDVDLGFSMLACAANGGSEQFAGLDLKVAHI